VRRRKEGLAHLWTSGIFENLSEGEKEGEEKFTITPRGFTTNLACEEKDSSWKREEQRKAQKQKKGQPYEQERKDVMSEGNVFGPNMCGEGWADRSSRGAITGGGGGQGGKVNLLK